ncbi:undecaprenyldiphospho-muramoylpentapeptide beta-N-acetylglucosaminyltransferase [Candidatus Peregrinibacteria bacterium]|nr:undecaprenyldiphospho-muramoylpentapeptide beta-N-acetylglucosaminyltransferase [Candidatus Peregrinibacteria bacterium]
MRIVLTGGGTGGHVIPNLAVIEELKSRGENNILYIGSKNGIEKNLIKKAGVDYEGVHTGKLRRYFSWENFWDTLKVPLGIISSIKILKKYDPDVIFSKGGYVSVPVMAAGYYLKVPIITHESDIVPGMANKIGFKMAKKICLSFEKSKDYIADDLKRKVIVTGTPIRKDIFKGNENEGYRFTGFDRYRPVILVMGGSRGAMQINELVRSSLDELLRHYQIVHLVGRGNIDISLHKKGYKQFEYLNEEMKDVYAISKMVISRGGANSLSEIAALKKKALIIPLGKASSRGDQIDNAEYFCKKFGWSVLSGEISREQFIDAIKMALKNEFIGGNFKNGCREIVDLILNKGR